MLQSTSLHSNLELFFKAFPHEEVAYCTESGLIVKQEDLENVIEVIGANQLMAFTRHEIMQVEQAISILAR